MVRQWITRITLALRHATERIAHSGGNRPIGKLPAADAGYRAAGDGGHCHFGKAVVVGGELNGRRGSFGDETASRIEPVMAYPFLLVVVVLVINQQDTPLRSEERRVGKECRARGVW